MIITIFCCQILISIQQHEFQNFLYKNETICVDQKQYIFLESDEPNIEEIKNIDQDLLQTSFKLNIKEDEIIQQLLVMNSLHFRAKFAFCLCQLIQSQNFEISCIDGIHIDYDKNEIQQIKQAKQFKIQLLNTSDVVCDSMYSDIFNQLKVICQQIEHFFIYQINLRQQTVIKITSNLISNISNCQIKHQQFEDKELVIFYQCEDWKIFLVDNKELTIYLDQNILQNYQIEIKFLRDVISCQQFLYIIALNDYYIFQQTKTNLYIFLSGNTLNEIIKLVVTERCEVIFSLNTNKEKLFIEHYQKSMEIEVDYIQNQTEIFYLSQYLIIKNESHLRILITGFISQNYSLIPSKFYQIKVQQEINQIFVSIPNLFYQINYETKVIQFYKFLKPQSCITPQKKYLYEITSIPHCLLFNSIIQYEIVYQDNNYIQSYINLNPIKQTVYKNCTSIESISVSKDNLAFPQIYELQVKTRPDNLIISIEDEEELKDLCPNLDMNKNLQIVWIGQFDEVILAIILNNSFYIFNCKNSKINLLIDVQDKLVFTYQGNFFIAQLNKKQYQRIIYSKYNNVNLISEFQGNIEYIKQIQNNLLIQISDQTIVYDLISGSFNQLDEQYQQFSFIDYFNSFNTFIDILQSGDFLLIKYVAKKTYQLVKIKDVQIIDTFIEKNYLRLRAIHRLKNLILIYFFNGEQLIVEQELLLNDYQFIRPIIYSKSKQLIIIAALTNLNEKVYLFINTEKVISLIKHIYISEFNALLSNKLFLYSDNKSNLRILNISEYIFKLKIDFKLLSYSYQISQNFDIFYKEHDQFQKIKGIIQLNIISKCYEISIQQNKSIIYQSQNFQPLNLGKIFFGPIDTLRTNNSDIQLNGPFLRTKIQNCSENSKDLCQQQIKITFLEDQYSQLMCLFNHSDTIINLSYCNFYEMSEGLKIYQYFYIIKEQLFIVFTNELDQLHKIMIFTFDSTSLILTQIQEENFGKQSDIQYNTQLTQIRQFNGQFFITLRVEKQFINQQFTLSINNINYKKMDLIYSDIVQVKNTEDYYILLQSYIGIEQSFVFYLIKIQNFKEIIIQQTDLTIEQIKKLFNGQYPDFNEEKFKTNSTLSLIESIKINNHINTIFIIITEDITFQIQLKINIDTFEYIYRIFKIIRNPDIKNQLFINFCDLQIMILQDSINNKSVYYLYDLREEKEMYDYINKFENQEFILQKFNNTFYFFQQNENQQLFIGQIGFMLELLGQAKHERVNIIAENQISQAMVEVIFTNSQQEYSFQLNYIIIAILVLLLLIYLIRRQLLKKQWLKIKIESNEN